MPVDDSVPQRTNPDPAGQLHPEFLRAWQQMQLSEDVTEYWWKQFEVADVPLEQIHLHLPHVLELMIKHIDGHYRCWGTTEMRIAVIQHFPFARELLEKNKRDRWGYRQRESATDPPQTSASSSRTSEVATQTTWRMRSDVGFGPQAKAQSQNRNDAARAPPY